MNTLQAINDDQLTQVAEQAYIDQKDDFICEFKSKLKQSLATAQTQLKNGQSMNFDDFKERVQAIELK